MASFMAMLRKGHLEYLYHIFAFLRIRHNAELILDPSEPGVDLDQFKKEKWSTTPYGDDEEAIPMNKHEARG